MSILCHFHDKISIYSSAQLFIRSFVIVTSSIIVILLLFFLSVLLLQLVLFSLTLFVRDYFYQ